MACGKDHSIRLDRLPGQQAKRHGLSGLAEIDTSVANVTNGARRQNAARELADVVAISRTWDKAERRRTTGAVGMSSPLQPLMQVVRLIAERAHVGDPHVEQVPGI